MTIGERLAALRMFDAFKGSITQLASTLDDVKKIAITLDDWTAAGRVVTKNPEGGESWSWNDDAEATFKEVELSSDAVEYLTTSIKAKSDSKEITIADKALISLNTKLQ